MRSKKIGVFDSGFGGLTVLKEIINKLPEYEYIYLGDSARAPYGPRSQKEIYEFTRQAVEFLFKKGCELIIIACNTASSEALRKIQQEYLPYHHPQKRVLGVIVPTAEAIFEEGKPKNIGVIGTEGTIKSQSYEREITKINPRVKISGRACPMIVPAIESGFAGEHMTVVLKEYLDDFVGIDTLILGCTHYAIVEDKIKKIIGNNVRVFNQSKITAEKLAGYLKRHPELEEKLTKSSSVKFYSTDVERFSDLGSKLMGEELDAKKARLN